MKTTLSLVLLTLFLTVASYPFESKLSLIRSIGDDARDEYTFFLITDAVLSDKKDIYVIDHKGYCVSKFNWDGVFQKRVGQRGKGPGDFASLKSIQFFNNRLHILDWKNRRIASTNTDLDEFQYLRYLTFKYNGDRFKNVPGEIILLEDNRFLGISSLYTNGIGRLFIYDSQGNIEKTFLNDLPIKKSTIDESPSNLLMLSRVAAAVNPKNREIMATFSFPDNEIVFYLFNMSGDLLKSFSYKQDKCFHFPTPLLNRTIKGNAGVNFSVVETIHPSDDFFLVFLTEMQDIKELGHSLDGKGEYFLLVFDKGGKFLHKRKMEKPLTIYHISSDGYVLAKDATGEEDIEKLLIYKLELKK